MTPYMGIAAIAWLTMVTGYFARRDRRTHVRLMLSAIGLDIILVIFLEVTRGAIETAASFTLPELKQVHIAFSSIAFALYFPVLYLGWSLNSPKIKINKAKLRRYHICLASLAFFFRTMGFLFMFSMWKS